MNTAPRRVTNRSRFWKRPSRFATLSPCYTRSLMNSIKWFAAGILTIATAVVLAQPPGPPGGFGASGRGRGGGGGGGGFVSAPKFDTDPPVLPTDLKSGGVLIYSKTNGFREEAAVQASDTALAAIAHERSWPYYVTENGAVMNKDQLA